MRILHLIPNIDSKAPQRLHEEVRRSQASLKVALGFIPSGVDVTVTYVSAPGENRPVPDWAKEFAAVESIRDKVGRMSSPPLVLLSDVLRAVDDSYDQVVVSNSDICVSKNFYGDIVGLIQLGTTSGSIHRETIPDEPDGNMPIAADLNSTSPTPHPGSDCFFFPSQHAKNFKFHHLALGLAPVGDIFILNLALCDLSFKKIRNSGLTFHFGDSRDWTHDSRSHLSLQAFHFAKRAVSELFRQHGRKVVVETAFSIGLFMPTWRKSILPLCRPSSSRHKIDSVIRGIKRGRITDSYSLDKTLDSSRPQAYFRIRSLVRRAAIPAMKKIFQYATRSR